MNEGKTTDKFKMEPSKFIGKELIEIIDKCKFINYKVFDL